MLLNSLGQLDGDVMLRNVLISVVVVAILALLWLLIARANQSSEQRAARKQLGDAKDSAFEARRALSYSTLTGYPLGEALNFANQGDAKLVLAKQAWKEGRFQDALTLANEALDRFNETISRANSTQGQLLP